MKRIPIKKILKLDNDFRNDQYMQKLYDIEATLESIEKFVLEELGISVGKSVWLWDRRMVRNGIIENFEISYKGLYVDPEIIVKVKFDWYVEEFHLSPYLFFDTEQDLLKYLNRKTKR